MIRLLAGVLAVGALALGGCKESVGETCQIDADCDKDLVCNQAQKVCALPGTSGNLDAGTIPLPDAPPDSSLGEAAVAPDPSAVPSDDEVRADEARDD